MSRYRLSFHIEFDAIDDVHACESLASASAIAFQLGALREDLNGDPEYSIGKLQQLYSNKPPRIVRWFDVSTSRHSTAL